MLPLTQPTDHNGSHVLTGFPSTRYQGSKVKVVPWIYSAVSALSFDTVLDPFGGSGTVSYLFKKMGKQVTYNDYLVSNYWSGVALIENSGTVLTDGDLAFLLCRHERVDYPSFIADTFSEIYYTDAENHWLDQIVANISLLDQVYDGMVLRQKRALAYHSLTQSCLMKRPFNLFHRRNLHIRTADVSRRFGNKITWERPFPYLFGRFSEELRRVTFENGRSNRAINLDAMDTPIGSDLVYIDTPYLRTTGGGHDSDYHSLYHFLDGLCRYDQWQHEIDYNTPHRRLRARPNGWNDRSRICEMFETFIKRNAGSIIVISYRSPGFPSRTVLEEIVAGFKKTVCTYEQSYKYALNRQNGKAGENIELLIVGT